MPLNIYYDKDADLGRLDGKTVAVIGYGSQGHAHSQNLHNSGVNVVVGLRKESSSWQKAEGAGLRVLTPAEAASEADVIMLTLPDETAAAVYREEIEPGLQPGNYVAVAHGFNVHFGTIQPPENVNVFMVAPKGPGHTVRQHYEEGRGVPALVAVAGPASSRPTSARRPRPTSSASRRCSAGASPRSCGPATRPSSRPATPPRWPTSRPSTR